MPDSTSPTPKADYILERDIQEFTRLYSDATEMDKQFRTEIIDLRHIIFMAMELLGGDPYGKYTTAELRQSLIGIITHNLDQLILTAGISSRPKGSLGNPEQVKVNFDHLILLLDLLNKYREEILYWVEEDNEKYVNYRGDFEQIAEGVKVITTAFLYGREKK